MTAMPWDPRGCWSLRHDYLDGRLGACAVSTMVVVAILILLCWLCLCTFRCCMPTCYGYCFEFWPLVE
eukprot:6555183-Prymnesium_polylepis.1